MTQTATQSNSGLLGKNFGRPKAREPVSGALVRTWLINRLATHLRVPPDVIDVEMPFADYGLDSRTAVGLAGELEKLIDREVPHSLVWDYPTISAVVRFVEGA
jgi:acyl carrier protein